MENLNSDIVLEILSRLPKTKIGFKSVLQCRQVCQPWRTLLGKPKTGILFVRYGFDDIKLYYKEKSSEMVTFNSMEEAKKLYTMLPEINSNIQTSFNFVGTCNSLLCYEVSDFIFIYNPITDERLRIPKNGSEYNPVGFGYCRSTNTYKVVRIGESSNGKRSVQVYTLGDGSGWRQKPEVTYMLLGSGVLANGALHWYDTRSDFDIVAFDLADESFRSVPSPPCHAPSNSHINLHLGSLLGQNLYLSLHYIEQGECVMDIWVFEKNNMNNLGHSSCLNDRTDFNSFTWIRRFSKKWDKCSTRLLSRTESEILLWQNDGLGCYDPKTFEKIWFVEGAKRDVYEAIPHMHSLVSLKGLGEERVVPLVLPIKVGAEC